MWKMAKSRFNTCFILAPIGVDTSVVRRTLEERSIQWFDQTNLKPGSRWADAIEDALTRSDFVCVVLPEGRHGNVLFELGIAYAKRKPILAIVESPTGLPSDIFSLTYVRANPKDQAAVQSALRTFLEHATVGTIRKSQRSQPKRGVPKSKELIFPPSAAQKFEQKTAALLEKGGFIVSRPTEGHDKGADFAVWIDDLQHSLGNPMLVEVKAGNLSINRIREAASELRAHVEKTHGGCALLVYWDKQNRKFPAVSAEWPLVFQLSGTALTRLVRRGRLPDELIRLRNAAVHGEV
jgi:hypothetical protein